MTSNVRHLHRLTGGAGAGSPATLRPSGVIAVNFDVGAATPEIWVSNGAAWLRANPPGVAPNVRGVAAGADQGSIEDTFNNDAVTIAAGDIVVYSYNGTPYIYTGPIGTSGAAAGPGIVVTTANEFTSLGAAARTAGDLIYQGGVNPVLAPTGAAATSPASGDVYVVTTAGAVEATWGLGAINADLGDLIMRQGTTWALIRASGGKETAMDLKGAVDATVAPAGAAAAAAVKTGDVFTVQADTATPHATWGLPAGTVLKAGDWLIKTATGWALSSVGAGGLISRGSLDPTAALAGRAAAPQDGDVFTASATGTANAGWGLPANTRVETGDWIVREGGAWKLVRTGGGKADALAIGAAVDPTAAPAGPAAAATVQTGDVFPVSTATATPNAGWSLPAGTVLNVGDWLIKTATGWSSLGVGPGAMVLRGPVDPTAAPAAPPPLRSRAMCSPSTLLARPTLVGALPPEPRLVLETCCCGMAARGPCSTTPTIAACRRDDG